MRPARFGFGARILFALCLLISNGAATFDSRAETNLPEPGPENSGLRLRFVVTPEGKGTGETYRVRLDLINVTDKPIELIGDWPGDRDTGDFKDYLEADVNIETMPELMPPMYQAMMERRKTAQPTYTLKPQTVLTL